MSVIYACDRCGHRDIIPQPFQSPTTSVDLCYACGQERQRIIHAMQVKHRIEIDAALVVFMAGRSKPKPKATP